ncbi:hypothetical protein EDF60_0239 [Leucobacter luti]|uniref:hypothetical protein n=1 Tax=Leucobacter luti TaxID=340320 RepID=UPI00104F43AB|nr:hypothetical protein [Leucobacter luti]MCW2288829.1 hypothetical protein [Leucobacter luti]TCK45020.1 hypothetical protein EDF60_0239 [Leucobacter luti]
MARTVDAGGLTQDEAGALSIEEQFDLVRERDARMQELLTEAQLVISDGVWIWGQKGAGPIAGPNAWALPGMELENSYFLQMWRGTQPAGATGAKQDLDPMLDYFKEQGWETTVRESSGPNFEAVADTGEGFLVSWTVKANGLYNMEVMSQSYWGDSRTLLHEIVDRIPPEETAINESLPGVYIKFPDWSDPVDYAPNLQDHGE